MRLHQIPLGLAFLPALARGTIARFGTGEELSATTILLPTRRSARALQTAFLHAAGVDALLLPRMRALAGLSVEDADELALPSLLTLPPAVEPLRRQAVLAGFAARMPRHAGGPPTAEHAWSLGGEMAKLLDEIALEEAETLPDDPAVLEHTWLERLDALAPENLAVHWQITTRFLRGVVDAWQEWLHAQGLLDIGVRRVLALRAQRREWEDRPPATPVIAAGIGLGGTVPAAADLLRSIATRLPQGFVVLPGEDAATAAIPDDVLTEACSHPMAGQRRMLLRMGASMAEATPWTDDAPPAGERAALLGMALLPAGALRAWQRRTPARWPAAMAGLDRLDAADAQQEAAAIALTLRGALEKPGARAALVTPDRDLAGRVAAELPRHGILAEDSAGQPLGQTPNGNFLRLVAHLAAGECGPVPLLGVLKHPLCAAGWLRADWMAAVHRLELTLLRGPAPGPGLDGLRAGIVAAAPKPEVAARLDALVAALDAALGPFRSLPREGELRRAEDLLDQHLAAAERLATTPTLDGGLRLYAQAEGEALARHLAALRPAMAELPPLPPADWPRLFEAALSLGTTRAARISRGRGEAHHPHVEILGLIEARLLDFDCVVLGALDESVWPQAADPGPWMSRPMRRQFGLPSPELRIGRVAADFLTVACSGRQVTLSRAARRGGGPNVPARWLTRLSTFLRGQAQGLELRRGQGLALAASPAAAWAEALDRPAGPAQPQPRAGFAPPLSARPHRLSATGAATLLADPYAFYAQQVLRLRPLNPLEQEAGAAGYGNLVHAAIHGFLRALPLVWPGESEAAALWERAALGAEAEAHLRPAIAALWRPRLARIGHFLRGVEAARRPGLLRVEAEIPARLMLTRPGGALSLEARADRLDVLGAGGLRIIDYKTGTLPETRQLNDGSAPQLPLEALLAEAGAFRDVPGAPVTAIEFWHLTGAIVAGEVHRPTLDLPALTEQARHAVEALADRFLFGRAAFVSRPHPRRSPRPDYVHLARIAEWSAEIDLN